MTKRAKVVVVLRGGVVLVALRSCQVRAGLGPYPRRASTVTSVPAAANAPDTRYLVSTLPRLQLGRNFS